MIKKRFLVFAICPFLVSILYSPVLWAQSAIVSITNPTGIERSDDLLVLKRSAIKQKLGDVQFVTAKIGSNKLVVQHDDLNGDGRWDEVAFLLNLKPRQTVLVTIMASGVNDAGNAEKRAHVRLRKKNADDTFGPSITTETMPLRHPNTDFSKQPLPLYLTEGPAWENDKIAFRLYFDIRNGKDIFGKRTSRMMMDTVGVNKKSSYHDVADWGMDILHAGKSLGSGSLALMVPQNGKDTLIRLGGDSITHTVYQQVADGPVRAIFTMTYNWQVMGKAVTIVEQTSIWGGQYFYEDKVTVNNAPAGSLLVAGIASFYNNIFQGYNIGNCGVMFSHGLQSENKDNLGMAIVVPGNNMAFVGSTPNQASEILNTYIAAQYIKNNVPCRFRFYGAWELTNSRFASVNYFKSMLNSETVKMDKPVRIQWK